MVACSNCTTSVEFPCINEEGDQFCDDCFEELYNYCTECGNLYELTRPCSCLRYNVLPWDSSVRPVFYGQGGPYYGTELETEGLGRRTIGEELGEELYMIHDGCCDIEITGHPMTWDHMQKVWEPVLELRKKGLKSWNTSSCGIHIHIDKDHLSALDIYKILLFLQNNESAVCEFGRKRANILDEYSRWTDFEGKAYRARCKCNRDDNRYQALNMEGPTVEFRYFRGSLNPVTFWAFHEHVKSLVEYVKVHGMKDMIWHKYKAWVRDNKKYYPNLVQRL